MTEEQRTEEEQRLASSVRVSVLNVTPSGRTMVGFTDSSAKPPEHYYLPVGGERDGWAVKAADPATEKVTLAKGEVEVTLKLGEGSTGDGKGDKQKATGRGMSPASIRRGGMTGARLSGGGPLTPPGAPGAHGESSPAGGALARLRERRTRLMQEQQAEAARRTAAANEEKAENERREAEAKAAAAEAAAEREQLRADREQQRAALLQIQEELRRQREEKEKRQAQESQEEQPEQ